MSMRRRGFAAMCVENIIIQHIMMVVIRYMHEMTDMIQYMQETRLDLVSFAINGRSHAQDIQMSEMSVLLDDAKKKKPFRYHSYNSQHSRE